MAEMLAVVAIIGLLAATASPSFIRQMRDTRVNRAAAEIAETFRFARARSLGRGSAVLVGWDSGTKTLTTREATDAAGWPISSCTGVTWTSADIPRIASSSFSGSAHELADISLTVPGLVDNVSGSICFTPRGRAFVSASADGSSLTPLRVVATFDVVNTDNKRARTVFVPPSGVARLAL